MISLLPLLFCILHLFLSVPGKAFFSWPLHYFNPLFSSAPVHLYLKYFLFCLFDLQTSYLNSKTVDNGNVDNPVFKPRTVLKPVFTKQKAQEGRVQLTPVSGQSIVEIPTGTFLYQSWSMNEFRGCIKCEVRPQFLLVVVVQNSNKSWECDVWLWLMKCKFKYSIQFHWWPYMFIFYLISIHLCSIWCYF